MRHPFFCSPLRLWIGTPLFAGALVAQTQTLVIPSANANVDGNSSTHYPFPVTEGRFLFIYDSSHFTNNGINHPIQISQVRFRADGSAQTWSGGHDIASVTLGHSLVDYSAISAVFDDNPKAFDFVDLPFIFTSAGSASPGVPGPFATTWSPSFTYDPRMGDLWMSVQHLGQSVDMPTLDAVTTTGVAKAKMVYSSSYTSPTGVVWSGEIANVVEITYSTAPLTARFLPLDALGSSPLTVHFTDYSWSPEPGGVTSWAWDFDGDGTTDLTVQNPTFVYNNCGRYYPTMTAYDGINQASRSGVVAVDPITVDFTFTPMSPANVIQFQDISSPPATTWRWDFDSDGTVDSTVQNPLVTMPPNCEFAQVSLNASACLTGSATKPVFVSGPNSLLTTNIYNNSGAPGSTVMFDVAVLNPQGVNICAMDVSLFWMADRPFDVDVYVTDGSHVGKDNDITQWRLAGTASGTAVSGPNGTNVLLPAVLSRPIYLPVGNYGLAIHYPVERPRYTNSTSSSANSDLRVYSGMARSTLFNGGLVSSPRRWNGRLYYDTATTGGSAGFGFFGSGCAGSMGVSTLTSLGGWLPRVGSPMNLEVDNLPFNTALMLTGLNKTTSPLGSLPLDLTTYGAPGCFLRVNPQSTEMLLGVSHYASWGISIPPGTALLGMRIYNQALVVDTGFNSAGAVVSDATGMLIGL
ncbi:MAG: PKD domain-containing protein [Planctomycetes bacterium]|nr:PKD domain-containing protein [Planctomycetota bacterium]